jgi:CMP-N,N'-diacetyllegionaminic acid synthase
MSILYVIPARGGSKGLPGKNIRPLCGKPLIAHSIELARNLAEQGTVLVSTDDEAIAAVAREYGAELPFMRPAELATDAASTSDVLLHALQYYQTKSIHFDLIVLLQPTSPMRHAEDVEGAIRELRDRGVPSVVSVCENEHHHFWSNTLPEDRSLRDFIPAEVKGLNRQQMPKSYRLNGAVYVSTVDAFKKNRGFYHDETYAYIMPSERSVDIDHEIDFNLAECLMQLKR